MSDFQERLSAADPFAGQAYAHHDATAMVSRIIAQHPIARRSALRDFKLRMAGAVTMATLVTFGGIAALDAAVPGLPVLSLASGAKSTHTPQVAGTATSGMMMRIYEEFNFTPGSALSSSASTGAAYQLVTPSDPSGEATRLAAIFSVSGSPVDTNGDGSYWSVTDASGAAVNYDNSYGVPQWYFATNTQGVASPPTPPTSSSPSAQSSTSSALPSQSTVASDVATLMQRLGYGYQLSDPQFSTDSFSSVGADATTTTTSMESVAYSVKVDGVLTDQTVQFSFVANNTLVSASGPAFSVAAATNYPLQSPVDGVAVLNTQQQSYFKDSSGGSPIPLGSDGTVTPQSSGSNPPTTDSGSSTGSVATPGTNDTTSTVVTGPPIVNVTLDSVAISLQSYTLKDGTLWLLPVYSYSGVVTSSDGSSSTGTWTTIAVDPTYVQISSPTGPIFY